MSHPELARYAALGVGAFQLLANAATLLRGFAKLPELLATEGATARVADLLRTAWVYGTLGNLCLSVVLLFLAGPLSAGDPLARRVAVAIGIYYLGVGVATYAFAANRHLGLLIFTALGVVLLAALWL